MLEPIITYETCKACRKCCIFTADELEEAPLFTDAEHERLRAEHPEVETFRDGSHWRAKLRSLDQPKRWVCPLYETATAACKVQAYKPFNCRAWPAMPVRREGALEVVLAKVCPAVNTEDVRARARQYVRREIAPEVLEQATRFPEFVVTYRADGMSPLLLSDE